MAETTPEALVERLRRSIITASNDDATQPMTDQRKRHVERLSAMEDAAAFLEQNGELYARITRLEEDLAFARRPR